MQSNHNLVDESDKETAAAAINQSLKHKREGSTMITVNTAHS